MVADQDARVRGAVVVGTGAGGVVNTGAVVAGGVVTGADGAAGAGVAADGAGALAGATPLEAAGMPADDALDEPADDAGFDDVAAGDGTFGGAPALGGTVASVAVPTVDGVEDPTTPLAPVTFSSTVGNDVEPDDGPLSASAATMAVVAARLRPAVKARDAGAAEPRFFFGAFEDEDEPSVRPAAARAAAGIRSVIVLLLALSFAFKVPSFGGT